MISTMMGTTTVKYIRSFAGKRTPLPWSASARKPSKPQAIFLDRQQNSRMTEIHYLQMQDSR